MTEGKGGNSQHRDKIPPVNGEKGESQARRKGKAGAYDFVIIDMPPAFSLAARASLAAADEVIVPIKLDAFSVDGMAELLRQIAAMRKINPALTLAGVLVTMWRNVGIVTQAEGVLRRGSFPVFSTVIRRTDRVDESTFQRQPLRVYSPRSAANVDYRMLVEEYLRGRCVDGEAV